MLELRLAENRERQVGMADNNRLKNTSKKSSQKIFGETNSLQNVQPYF